MQDCESLILMLYGETMGGGRFIDFLLNLDRLWIDYGGMKHGKNYAERRFGKTS